MKKLFLFLPVGLLCAAMAFAQDTGGDKTTLNPQPLPPGRHPKVESKTKKGHKGGKKSTTDQTVTTDTTNKPVPPPKPTVTAPVSSTTGQPIELDSGKKASKQYAKKAAKNKRTPKTGTDLEMKPGGPGVPPPTRPTDPK